jgi:probable F420-dependent oxidoreductase
VTRPFRFGLQVFGAQSRREWQDKARRAEALGFDTVVVPDHVLTPGPFAPIAAVDALAEVTSQLRIGTLVLNNDLRHPALVARDAATLDLLSDGRFELGIGAGHAQPEYTELGVPFDRPATRAARLAEAASILRRLFDGETVTTHGAHYRLRAHTLFPHRRVRLLVGGNGNRVLRTAAEHADIVGFTGLGRTLDDGQRHEARWRLEEVDAKVDHVRAVAGDRIADLELNVLVQEVRITDNREAAIDEIARRVDTDPTMLRIAPFVLIGSPPQIVEQLHHARERWGFSYFVTRNPEATATIIEAIRDHH